MAKTSEDIARGIASTKSHPAYVQASLQPRQLGKSVLAGITLLLTDLLAIFLALLAGLSVRLYILPVISPRFTHDIPQTFFNNIWWITVILISCFAYEGLYSKRLTFWREARNVVKAISLGLLLILALIFLAKLGGEFSRTTLVLTYCFALLIIPLCRYICKNQLFRMGVWNESVLILGAGETGKMVATALVTEPYLGYSVFGFLEDDPVKKKNGVNINGCSYCILGDFHEAARIIRLNGIQHVILAAPGLPGSRIVELANELKNYSHSVEVIPDLPGMPVSGAELDYLFNDQIIAYRTRNNLSSTLNMATKNLFDILLGSFIFILVIPILGLIYHAVKINSKGPAIFSGIRIGRNGKEFKCYKFRTMYENNDEILEKYLAQNPDANKEWVRYAKLRRYDPRVTRIGKLLRLTSLDELPQILNVVKGDMSLVGPRPYLPREREDMGNHITTILMTKPGITGLWQVSGRNDIDFVGRLEMETWYVRNWSMWLDISLLFKTIAVVLGRKGAY